MMMNLNLEMNLEAFKPNKLNNSVITICGEDQSDVRTMYMFKT